LEFATVVFGSDQVQEAPRADVAEFLVKQVNDARLIHKTPALIG
jgi:hypothetical protein